MTGKKQNFRFNCLLYVTIFTKNLHFKPLFNWHRKFPTLKPNVIYFAVFYTSVQLFIASSVYTCLVLPNQFIFEIHFFTSSLPHNSSITIGMT